MANTNGKKLTSSIGYQYFGKGADGSDKSLSVSYLENNISIGIFSLLPESQQTDKSRFDYNSGHVIYIKGKQAKMLAKLIKKCDEDDGFEPKAISSGSNLIEVARGTNYGMDKGVTIAIYNNINPDKTCEAPATFQFSHEKIISNYKYENGSYDEAYAVNSDIDYFVDQLLEFAKGITNAAAHCIKKEFSFDINKFTSRQLQCCQALGINFETPQSARNSWNNQQYSNNNHQRASNISTDDLLNELGGLD